MTTALQTKALTKIYHSGSTHVTAVDHVSLTIEDGEFVAMVGPSGSGKTTMLALLAGLLKPTEGEIRIGGEALNEMSDSRLTQFRGQKIGFVFQSSNLLPYLTARENVELMLKLNGTLNKSKQEDVTRLLVRLGLEERLNGLPSQLSGGQQQRVAIARALIHNPRLVLADEPTANLDTERAYQVVKTFASLIREQKRAGIMVTHDLRMCRYVDKVVYMTDGKIAEILEDRAEIEALAQMSQHQAEGEPVAV